MARQFSINFILIILLVIGVSATAQGLELQRTTLKVDNLTCPSCLNRAEVELKKLPGMVGMAGDWQKGVIIADHGTMVNGETIAKLLTRIGYGAKALQTNAITSKEANYFSKSTAILCGIGGCDNNKKRCGATASAWKELYRRYIKPADK